MRRRLAAALAAVTIGLVLAGCGGGGDGDGGDAAPASGPEASGLGTRTVKAGAIDVKIEPVRIDADGAVFDVTLDTHSEDLSMDPAAGARLDVGGTPWEVGGWTGDGPGGHHREGELAFRAAGPAEGTATLVLSGFPGPVEASWSLG